jgi:hypothetical protein
MLRNVRFTGRREYEFSTKGSWLAQPKLTSCGSWRSAFATDVATAGQPSPVVEIRSLACPAEARSLVQASEGWRPHGVPSQTGRPFYRLFRAA